MKLTYWLEPLIVKSIWNRYEDDSIRYDIISLYSPTYKTSLEIELKYKNDTYDSVSYYLTRKTNESIIVPGFLSDEYKDMKVLLKLNKSNEQDSVVESIECEYDKFKLKNLNFKYAPSCSSFEFQVNHKIRPNELSKTENIKKIIDTLTKVYHEKVTPLYKLSHDVTDEFNYDILYIIEY